MITGEHKMKCSSWNQMQNALRGTKCKMLLVEPNVECSRGTSDTRLGTSDAREGTSDAREGTLDALTWEL